MSGCAAENTGCLPLSRATGAVLLGLLLLSPAAAVGAAAEGQPAANRVGRAMRISLPITGQTVHRAEQFVRKAIDKSKEEGGQLVLIFEFEVGKDQAEFGRGTKFGDAYELAKLLTSKELKNAWTVAYVPQSIQGHAVLAVLACDEIMMAPQAKIGLAGCDEEVITNVYRDGYKEIANSRNKTIPALVALWMLDPRQEVFVVETEVSREYVTAAGLEELRKQHAIKPPRKLFDRDWPDLPLAAENGLLTGSEARALKFVSYLAASRQEVAKALDLPPEAAEEDLSLVGGWRPVRIGLKGPITDDRVSQVQRLIQEQIDIHDANFICLWIDSPGGSLGASRRLAYYLSDIGREGKVRTVAYIPAEARSDAALVATACREVVVHSRAELGGPGAREFSPADVAEAREAIDQEGGPWKLRPAALLSAIIDPQVTVFRCTRPAETVYLTAEQWEQYQKKHPEASKTAVNRPGEQLLVGGLRAVEYGLANRTAEDFVEFKRYYGLEQDPALLEPGWADFLIGALASPGVDAFLLLVGFVALYIELHTPGIGVGGFVATVCFVLFFWIHYLGGTAGWLEVSLFAVGVACLLLEFFVLPGFGIFGLGGGALVLASLILASQTFVWPHNPYQYAQLQKSLLKIAGAGVGFVAAAAILRKWLPQAPLFNQVLLEPPKGEEAQRISQRELLARFEDLRGCRGVTTTQLTPCGKARFGSRLVDVISEGDLIARGTEIEVVEVHGSRVLVKAVGGG